MNDTQQIYNLTSTGICARAAQEEKQPSWCSCCCSWCSNSAGPRWPITINISGEDDPVLHTTLQLSHTAKCYQGVFCLRCLDACLKWKKCGIISARQLFVFQFNPLLVKTKRRNAFLAQHINRLCSFGQLLQSLDILTWLLSVQVAYSPGLRLCNSKETVVSKSVR